VCVRAGVWERLWNASRAQDPQALCELCGHLYHINAPIDRPRTSGLVFYVQPAPTTRHSSAACFKLAAVTAA
jgi:hypothetical protein